jgi:hypothetical protein
VKETNFFLWQYSKGLEWYASLFRNSGADVPIGEFSPMYFSPPQVCARIAKDLPGCKIIITLRDPVERLYSHYRKGYEQAYFRDSFEDTLRSRPDLLDWSRYAEHVRRWNDSFGRENVLVLIHEDVIYNPQEFLNRVTDFIGIESISIAEVPSASDRVNAIYEMPRSLYLAWLARVVRDWLERRGAFDIIRVLDRTGLRPVVFAGGRLFPPLRAETELQLRQQFEPEIQQLEELLGRNLPHWRTEVPSCLSSR